MRYKRYWFSGKSDGYVLHGRALSVMPTISLLFATIATFTSGCGGATNVSSAPPTSANDPLSVTVDTYSYRLPQGWHQQSPEEIARAKRAGQGMTANLPTPSSSATGPGDGKPSGSYANVMEFPADARLTLADYQRRDVQNLTQMSASTDLRTDRTGFTKLGGEPAYFIDYHEGTLGSAHLPAELGNTVVAAVHGGRLYVFAYTTEWDSFKNLRHQFDETLQSWHWLR